MNPTPSLDSRVAALISAYADRAPIDIDPIVTARLAAVQGSSPKLSLFTRGPMGLGVAVVVLILALLTALVGASMIGGRQLLRHEPLSAESPDQASIIASYWKLHEGFVYVYEDGRVLFVGGAPASMPAGLPRDATFERRLSSSGIALVRSGSVDARDFLYDPGLPTGAWLDGDYRRYVPQRWAICFQRDNVAQDARQVVGRLPASAQSILRGTERLFPDLGPLGSGDWTAYCFEVARDDARRVVQALRAGGFDGGSTWLEPDFLDEGSDGVMSMAGRGLDPGSRIPDVWFTPVFPHGTFVRWGG